MLWLPALSSFLPVFSLLQQHPLQTSDNFESHLLMPPREVPLEVENYPVAPAELVLEQVHVYVRHGERTPVGVRLTGPPASIPEFWEMCHTGRNFRAAVAGTVGTSLEHETLNIRRSVERRDGTFRDGDCMLGELTDIGRKTTYNYGLALRKLYVEKLGFLPDIVDREGIAYFRSTNMPRTIESLQQVIHGLYPNSKYGPEVPRVLVRNGKDESLLGNMMGCRRLAALNVEFAHAAAIAMRHTLEPLDDKLSKYINGNPIRIDGQPRASGILDTIRSAQANGLRIPADFENKAIMDVLERAVVTEWFAGYKTEEFRRLAMGPLLANLGSKMKMKAEKGSKDPSKILIHSTHDTALAGLSQTLDVYDEKWPAFTSSIIFELFRKKEPQASNSIMQLIRSPWKIRPPPEHYVRMRYQNRNLSLPICAEEGNHLEGHPEFCTLAAFQKRVDELTPKDWDAECNNTNATSSK